MIKTIQNFKNENFYDATKTFFAKLNISLHEITTKAIDKNDLFENLNSSFEHVQDIYAIGMITDEFFKNGKTDVDVHVKKDYDGVLIFAVELDSSTPSRKILADISRTFNREYKYTPVIVLFKYGNKLSLSNTQRQAYKINKEGEKATKVTILRDIDTTNPHTGHIKILNDMQLNAKVNSYEELYMYWQEVFNVSVLNKSFYKDLYIWYKIALENITFPNDNDSNSIKATNTIRLITRVIFIWFLKEKDLVPNELFDKKHLDNILDYSDKNSSTYYKVILQNLFFATLNTEIEKRKFRDTKTFQGANKDYGNQDVYRYEKFIKDTKLNEWKSLFSQIPFVNGGLFENLDIVSKIKHVSTIRVDGFSDRDDNRLIVPDDIFFNKDSGLISILNRYKFTIAENTPIEEDVALDPELLGKVFENLLASYNPTTETTARNDTGSFYTPREIVNYMIDSCLINHFKKSIKDDFGDEKELDKNLHELLSYEDSQPFEDNVVDKIIYSIDNLKILDPAVGSGAYPMGILHKMVHILHKLDPNNEKWKQKQLDKIDDEVLKDEIKEVFDKNNNELDYGRKLYLIENTIFGIDIQDIAIQISKLRFFISLIVEQKVSVEKKNFGIRPLPNLEFKLMQGNSLLESINGFDPLDEKDTIKNKNNKTRIQNLRRKFHRFYKISSKTEKQILKDEIKSDIDELFKKALLNHQKELEDIQGENNILETTKVLQNKHKGQVEDIKLMKKILDDYETTGSSSEIFLYKIYFAEVLSGGGFDIVIGNPPYIRHEKIKELKPRLQNEMDVYKSYNGTADIYVYFFEKGFKLLKDDGILSFITSNKYARAKYGKEFREFILDNTNILEYIDFNGVKVFESATVDTSILSFKKSTKQEPNTFIYCDIDMTYQKNSDLGTFISENSFDYAQSDLSNESFTFANPKELKIKKRIEAIGTPLKEWNIKIYRGIQTGNNDVFIINEELKDKFIEEDIKSKELIKPIIQGRDIHRYSYDFNNKYLLYITDETNIKEYKPVYEYLLSKKALLDTKIEVQQGTMVWYSLYRPAKTHIIEFEKKKIIFSEIANTPDVFTYDKKFMLLEKTSFMLNGDKLEYLLALLNSKVLIFYMKNTIRQVGNGFQLSKIFVEGIPIPKIPIEEQKPFEILVDYILFAKENNMKNESSLFEAIVDGMVYDLYFEEEMKKADCFITLRVEAIVKPFGKYDNDEFKKEFVKLIYEIFKEDKTVQRGLIFSRNIEVVKIINGDKNYD